MLSTANINQGKASSYYSKENYYTQKETKENSQWFGKGAKALGLEGEVSPEAFSNLVRGLDHKGSRALAYEAGKGLPSEKAALLMSGAKDLIERALDDGLRAKKNDSVAKEGEALTSSAKVRGEIISNALDAFSHKGLSQLKTESSISGIVEDMKLQLKVAHRSGALPDLDLGKIDTVGLSNDLNKLVKTAFAEAKAEKNKLPSDLKQKILDSIADGLEKKEIPQSEISAFRNKLDQQIRENRLSAEKIKSTVGRAMKTLEPLELSRDKSLAIRKLASSELNRAKASPERRAGIDLTFSAPKSLSVQALVFKDERLLVAHEKAVERTLSLIEKSYSYYRTGASSEKNMQLSGKLTVARFTHDTSRDLDPQTHTHSLVLSLLPTIDKNGTEKFKALSNEPIVHNTKYLGVVYQNELAREAKKLYDLKFHPNGTFDIAHFSKQNLDVFSKRRQSMEAMGLKDRKDANAKALIGRKAKGPHISREALRERWLEEAKKNGITPAPPGRVQEKGPRQTLDKAIESALRQVSEKNVTFKKENLLLAVLENNLGQFSHKAVDKAFDGLVGEKIFPAKDQGRFVSIESLRVEKSYRALASAQIGQHQPFLDSDKTKAALSVIEQASEKSGRVMTEGQRMAIQETLTSKDGVIIWQGSAGSGKTNSLRPLASLLSSLGHEVKGYAPSASASKQLSDGAGIESKTLATLLVNPKEAEKGAGELPTVWVVDEASFISARDMKRLLELQKTVGSRLVIIGDTKQISSVDAGNSFLDLQKNVEGIKITYLNQSVRQLDNLLKLAVERLNAHDMAGGLKLLDQKIIEVKESARTTAVADYFLSLDDKGRNQSIVVARTNLERSEIADKIRAGLKAEGKLGNSATIKIFEKSDISSERLKYAVAYQTGDIIVPNKNVKKIGLLKNQAYQVMGIDVHSNSLQLRDVEMKGKQISLDLSRHNEISSFKTKQIKIYEGDRLSFTRNQHSENRLNNDQFKVTEISGKEAKIEFESGRVDKLDLNQRQFVDQSWVITTNKSQGLSKFQNIVSVDAMKRKEDLYVDITRAVGDVRIFCNNKEELIKQAETSNANKIASDQLLQKDLVEQKMREFYSDTKSNSGRSGPPTDSRDPSSERSDSHNFSEKSPSSKSNGLER